MSRTACALAVELCDGCTHSHCDALALATDLVRAIRDARDALADEADEPGPQGERALSALEILEDAIASSEIYQATAR